MKEMVGGGGAEVVGRCEHGERGWKCRWVGMVVVESIDELVRTG